MMIKMKFLLEKREQYILRDPLRRVFLITTTKRKPKELHQNKNALLERSHALRNIWGDANYFNGRSMDVYIAKLRKHLKGDDRLEILNVHGKGFKLVAPTD